MAAGVDGQTRGVWPAVNKRCCRGVERAIDNYLRRGVERIGIQCNRIPGRKVSCPIHGQRFIGLNLYVYARANRQCCAFRDGQRSVNHIRRAGFQKLDVLRKCAAVKASRYWGQHYSVFEDFQTRMEEMLACAQLVVSPRVSGMAN